MISYFLLKSPLTPISKDATDAGPNRLDTAGAVFFACFSHYDALFKKAKNKALEHSNLSSGEIFHRNLLINCQGHPPGIEGSTETTHTVLLVGRLKVFD